MDRYVASPGMKRTREADVGVRIEHERHDVDADEGKHEHPQRLVPGEDALRLLEPRLLGMAQRDAGDDDRGEQDERDDAGGAGGEPQAHLRLVVGAGRQHAVADDDDHQADESQQDEEGAPGELHRARHGPRAVVRRRAAGRVHTHPEAAGARKVSAAGRRS